MAFINIQDPTKREEIVQEYIKTRDAIRLRNENNKESNLIKEREIEERFRPIVTATEKSAEKIASVLKKDVPRSHNYDFYASKAMSPARHKYFSIYQENGSYRLGDADIRIDDENNILIYDTKFTSTPGLWDLIMLNRPDKNGKYTNEDLENYWKIVNMTDLMENPQPGSRSNHKKTLKWRFLQDHFAKRRSMTESGGPSRRRSMTDPGDLSGTEYESAFGEGIILPSNINSLKERLQLVCAERAVGNIEATTPEIVAILDELLRQRYISKPEYNEVCKRLGC